LDDDSPCQGCLDRAAAWEDRRAELADRVGRLEQQADRRADMLALLACLAVLLVAAWYMGWIRFSAPVLPGKGV